MILSMMLILNDTDEQRPVSWKGREGKDEWVGVGEKGRGAVEQARGGGGGGERGCMLLKELQLIDRYHIGERSLMGTH